jgi:hypothetical protein
VTAGRCFAERDAGSVNLRRSVLLLATGGTSHEARSSRSMTETGPRRSPASAVLVAPAPAGSCTQASRGEARVQKRDLADPLGEDYPKHTVQSTQGGTRSPCGDRTRLRIPPPSASTSIIPGEKAGLPGARPARASVSGLIFMMIDAEAETPLPRKAFRVWAKIGPSRKLDAAF